MVESCPQDSVLCSLPQLKMSQWMYSLLQLAGLLFYFFTAGGGRKVAMPLLLGAQWWRMRLVGDWMWLCFHTVGWWQEGYRACKKDCAIYLPNFFQNKWRKSLDGTDLKLATWLPMRFITFLSDLKTFLFSFYQRTQCIRGCAIMCYDWRWHWQLAR